MTSCDLTELQEFHRKFYHPSNARIWFYGDDDPKERLRILSGMYLYSLWKILPMPGS